MVYESILGVKMQHCLRKLHILFHGFIFTSTSQLLSPTLSLFVPLSMTFVY